MVEQAKEQPAPEQPLQLGEWRDRFDWRSRPHSRLHAHHEKRLGAHPTKDKPKLSKTTKPTQPSLPLPLRRRRFAPPIPHVHMSERFGPEIDAYKLKFETLLAAEEATQWDAFRERLETWTLEKLAEEGYVLTGLRGFWSGKGESASGKWKGKGVANAKWNGRRVASFTKVIDELGWNRFDYGSLVTICRDHPLTGADEPVNGTVIYKSPSLIQVAFDEREAAESFDTREDSLEEGEWRMDFGSNNVAFRRMRAAMDSLNFDPEIVERLVPNEIEGVEAEYMLAGTHLRDVLLKGFRPISSTSTPADPTRAPSTSTTVPGAFSSNQLIYSWARRYSKPNPVVVEGDPVLDLNETQTQAVAMMLSQRISLVQGPPGTGKTRTIVEAVKLLKLHFEVPQPLLVATYTNVAVDNLVAGLAAAGLDPLRVGGEEHPTVASASRHLDKYRLETRMRAHPQQKLVEKIEEKMDTMTETRRKAIEKAKSKKDAKALEEARGMFKAPLDKLRAQKFAIRNAMLHEIISRSDVICTTCITSASAALHVTDFPVVFLDEASMSTEPASLIPLMKGSRHVSLIGDHKQLPPVIASAEAKSGGLNKSLFERLKEDGNVPSIMLDTQYRMHPDISRFPSAHFYNHTLRDGTVDTSGVVRSSLSPPKSVLLEDKKKSTSKESHKEEKEEKKDRHLSVVFVDHAGGESKKDRSRINEGEAQIVCGIVEDLLASNPTLNGEDIGIIAPYVAQIRLLDKLLKQDSTQAQQFVRTLGAHRALQTGLIEVKTVDGFEGREKEVIIFSTVRNNPQGAIGFLADGRRLNVGLTRARRALFVLGNAGTLKDGWGGWRDAGGVWISHTGGKVWKHYIKWLEQERLIRRWAGGSFLPLGLGKGKA